MQTHVFLRKSSALLSMGAFLNYFIQLNRCIGTLDPEEKKNTFNIFSISSDFLVGGNWRDQQIWQ